MAERTPPGTMSGKPFDELAPAQKGWEFDASEANPRGYAKKYFGTEEPEPVKGKGPKHKKPKK